MIAKPPKIIDRQLLEVEVQSIIFIINNLKKYSIMDISFAPILNSVLFSAIGFAILLLSYFVIEKITPENTWKEIVQKNNIAVAIVFAAFIIGISMIISAAIHG